MGDGDCAMVHVCFCLLFGRSGRIIFVPFCSGLTVKAISTATSICDILIFYGVCFRDFCRADCWACA